MLHTLIVRLKALVPPLLGVRLGSFTQSTSCNAKRIWSFHFCNEITYRTASDIFLNIIRAPSSEFVSSSIPSWQILTAHAQPFRGARDLAFCLDSLLLWASSGGSGETARMRRLAWTFAARIGDKYQIRLTRSKKLKYKSHCIFSNHEIQMAKLGRWLTRQSTEKRSVLSNVRKLVICWRCIRLFF